MNDSNPNSPVIPYEIPKTATKTASIWLARCACFCAVMPSVVGILITLLYWVAWWDWLVKAGMMWITVGGLLVLSGFILSIIGLVQCYRAINARSALRLNVIALIASGLAVPIAYLCAMAGAYLAMSPHVNLVMYNDTTRRIDRVTVHFSGGDETLGPIAPGKTDSSRVRTHHAPGPLYITVEIGGKTKRTKDRVYADDHHLQQTYDMHIEEKELPD
jgi:hypothetical protein